MIIIVGSGAGGATVAKELALAGLPVTLIEKGPLLITQQAFTAYDARDNDLELLKTTCGGGSTMVSVGNGVRVLQEELKSLGIDISIELAEAEQELKVNPLPDSHLGKGTKLLMEAAYNLDLPIQSMPKFIRPSECIPCGKCSFGCPRNAKWTAMDFINEAKEAGAQIFFNTGLEKIIIEKGKLKGVNIRRNFQDTTILNSSDQTSQYIKTDLVILAAGAIETPRILQKSGIKAGNNLFMDTFVTVGGILKDIEFYEEVMMATLVPFDNFILAPHFSTFLLEKLKNYGAQGKDILGIMVKIKDENSGQVTPEKVFKQNTLQDVRFLAEGSAVAGSILSEAGVKPSTIISTHPRGAHPGGTAPIGKIVDENLETSVKGLFLSDASVLPFAPGAPPILTIIALAKRLAQHIIKKYAD